MIPVGCPLLCGPCLEHKREYRSITGTCNPTKCKELVVRKKNNNTQYEQICNNLIYSNLANAHYNYSLFVPLVVVNLLNFRISLFFCLFVCLFLFFYAVLPPFLSPCINKLLKKGRSWVQLCLFNINSNVTLFADDTEIHFSFKDVGGAEYRINEELKSINQWFSNNGLIGNTKKTVTMVIASHMQGSQNCQRCSYILQWRDSLLGRKRSFKYLGVIADE